jgi:2-polyprenyl-3-methyl-5-hydroxy-6-metoxy-1,4-benzoquinol methylase
VHASIYTITDQERMAQAANYFAWQGRLVNPHLGRRVVEVGCGIGNFTGMLLDRETVLAVDLDPACIARLRVRYAGRPNLHAFACEPSGAEFAGLARWRPDSCVCINVLEHIEDDGKRLPRWHPCSLPAE